MDLALFDFDGTITTRATYPGFLRFVVRPPRKAVGSLVLAPVIAGYHGGLVPEPTIRKVLSKTVFWREDPDRVRALGDRYAAEILPTVIRPEARDRLAWHAGRGDRIVVVSASLDAYLDPWCRSQGVDVICTRLEIVAGRLTGRYVDGDCCGEAKAARIRARYRLSDYATIHAYGDTEEDLAMFALAHRKIFRWQNVG
jgi:HAD superfamily hydrolase (TIGR01490 family)